MERKVIIYGAGKYGKALYHFLRKNNIEVDHFLQNRVIEEEFCEGLPVYALKDCTFELEDAIILLAVADREVKKYAQSALITRGIEGSRIFDCSHFIEDNCLTEKSKKEHYCVLCGNWVKEFLPSGVETEFFNRHYVIGGGKRRNVLCPKCGCLDRNRWCMFVLEHYTSIVNDPCTVLHFAPEDNITRFIKTNKACNYYSADLQKEHAMLQVDMTDILFRDATFDYIIVNHVLEHIIDEKTAISELKRVLKDDGMIVMSFPICMDQDTYEDESIVTEEDRLLCFGQEDHVRLYGRDYKERLEAYGLSVEVKIPEKELANREIEKYGFIKDDVILICKRKNKSKEIRERC